VPSLPFYRLRERLRVHEEEKEREEKKKEKNKEERSFEAVSLFLPYRWVSLVL
jgi:hypothetical protein